MAIFRGPGGFVKLLVLAATAAVFIVGCSTSGTVPSSEAADIWFNLGNAYTELGRQEDASRAYAQARRLNPELFSAGYNLARVNIFLEKYDDSLRILNELLEEDPENRIVLETIAWVYYLQGRDGDALDIYNQILKDSEVNRNALHNSAVILTSNENYHEALDRYKTLIEFYPEEKQAFFNIAFIESELGNYEEAALWLEKHLAESPGDTEAAELAGDIYTAQRRYAEAVESYRTVTAAEGLEEAAAGRVYFKIGEILLLYIEDIDGGMDSLRKSQDFKWENSEYAEGLLSGREEDWVTEAAEILNYSIENEPQPGL
jgi:tetratricopeptide (TPR) repeat protein